jgi:hypothetical protein
LTFYRIGGEDHPLPSEVTDGTAQFVQLGWAEGADGEGGLQDGVEFDSTGVAPLFFAANQNITPAIRELGGRLQTRYTFDFIHDESEPIHMVADGDPTTSYEELTPLGPYFRVVGRSFYFDLGLEIPLQAVRFYPPQGKELRTVDHIFVATGHDGLDAAEPATHGLGYDGRDSPTSYLQRLGIFLELVGEVDENRDALVEIPLDGSARRHVLVHMGPQKAIWEIAEIEIIAGGFIPDAAYRTQVLDLGGPASIGPIRWSGRQDLDARVEIRSRAGDDDTPNVYWRRTFRGNEEVPFDPSGKLLDRQAYERLGIAQRGPITLDAANWESWSAAYKFGDSLGVPFSVNDLNSFLQLEIEFASSGDRGGRLGFLEFAVSPRLVTGLVGEVSPPVAQIGVETDFTFAVRPTIEPGDQGFDGVELRFAAGRFTSVEAVRIDSDVVVFETEALDESSVSLRFPRLDFDRSGELLQIDFRGEIFRNGALLEGRASDSGAAGEVGQRVTGGEASAFLDGNSLSIAGERVNEGVLGDIILESSTFTPNGDGVNDVLQIDYVVLKVTEPTAVRVLIHDLAGRLVREVYDGADRAGRYARSWDGLDTGGQRVAPGHYLCRIEVEADQRNQRRTVIAVVAY